jgi:hypothetical protein
MHALNEMDFQEINCTIDKYQRSGIGKALLFLLPIKFFGSLIWIRELKKKKSIDESNKSYVKKINSLQILLGRTIILFAKKKDQFSTEENIIFPEWQFANTYPPASAQYVEKI